jgi:hypothetical protein
VDHFSLWTLGNVAAPLPVELAAFTAQQQGSAALLRWTTAQEKNNDRFEVEASADGKSFRPIGAVAGAGSTSSRHDYRFEDGKLGSYGQSVVYYRLRQVDRDGTATTSPVRAVSVATAPEPTRLLAYPNPAHDAVRVLLKGAAASAPLELFNALGQLVRSQAAADGVEAILSLNGLPAGVYVLRCGLLSQRLDVE